jgi:hypothetical protein
MYNSCQWLLQMLDNQAILDYANMVKRLGRRRPPVLVGQAVSGVLDQTRGSPSSAAFFFLSPPLVASI